MQEGENSTAAGLRASGTRGRAEEEAPRGLNSCGLSVRNYMYNPHGINVFNVTPVLMPVPYLPMYTLDLVHD